jgi:Rieske Fe-S protein
MIGNLFGRRRGAPRREPGEALEGVPACGEHAEPTAERCPGCVVGGSGAGQCSRVAPAAPLMKRSTFVRGMGAAAGLFAASGTMGAIARAAAQQSAEVAAGAAKVAAVPGLFLGSVKQLAKSQAAVYTDPASGDPAILLHLTDGRYVAYDAVCTHAGCTVQYDAKRQLMVCPCHGATYDPAHGAKVLAGPTSTPLSPLAVRVDASQNVYALDAKGTGSHINRLKPAPAYAGQTGDDGGGRGGGQGGGDGNGSGQPGDDGARVTGHAHAIRGSNTQRPGTLRLRRTAATRRIRARDD